MTERKLCKVIYIYYLIITNTLMKGHYLHFIDEEKKEGS